MIINPEYKQAIQELDDAIRGINGYTSDHLDGADLVELIRLDGILQKAVAKYSSFDNDSKRFLH